MRVLVHRQFADWFGPASVNPTAAELEIKLAAAAAAAAKVAGAPLTALDLVEAVYGVGKPVVALTWFLNALKDADPTLRLEDNENMLRVLAGCVLGILMTDAEADWSGVANAVLCASVSGAKEPLTAGYLPKVAGGCVARWQTRNRLPVSIAGTAPGAASGALEAAYAKLGGGADPSAMVEGVKAVGQELVTALVSQARRQDRHMASLEKHITQQREELDMLWWVVGGWVEELAQPLSRVPAACAPIVVGWSLGGLIRVTPQPMALPAIIARALGQVSDIGEDEVSVVDALAALPEALRVAYAQEAADLLPRFAHVAPVSAALAHTADAGWAAGSRMGPPTGIGPDVALPPHLLARQVCAERTMVRQLRG